MAARSEAGMAERRASGDPSSLGEIRGFAFDLDGTIWAGPTLLPGAAELVANLRGAGLGVVFASNSSRHGSALLARRLTAMGIDADDSDVVAAFDLVGDEILRRLGRYGSCPWEPATSPICSNPPATRFCRSMSGQAPRRWWWATIPRSISVGCALPRARSPRGRPFSR